MCCAHTVRKIGYFRPTGPADGQGNRGNYCVPRHRAAQILTQSKNSDNELKQTTFPTENARLLPKSAVFALWAYTSMVVGGLQGGHTKANLRMGAVPAPCRHAPLVCLYLVSGTTLINDVWTLWGRT